MKIFGKKRYHWQFERLASIIYWCLVLTLIFVGIILMLEDIGVYWRSIIIFAIALILLLFGLHRHFWIDEKKGLLHIVSFRKKHRSVLDIASISKVVVIKSYILIYSFELPKNKKRYNMFKVWQKIFIRDLAELPQFTGKIEFLEEKR